MTASVRRVCVIALATSALAAGSAPGPTHASGQAQQAPQFRVSTDLVELDVSVFDSERRPVRSLRATDFEIYENGVRQEIAAFVEIGVGETSEPRADGTAPGAATSDGRGRTEGRLVVIFMDDQISLNMLGLRTAKEVAREAIAQLAEADLAAVAFVNSPKGTRNLTNNRAELTAAVEGFRSAPQPGSSSLLSLRDVTSSLAALPGRRKLILYIGAGEKFDPDVMKASLSPLPVDAAGLMGVLFQRMQDLFRHAQRANVNLYTFDVNGLVAPTPADHDPNLWQREFLQIVANESGGRAVINHNRPDREVGRVFAENAAYYLIGFRSTNQTADGRYRRLEVKVARPDVTVRARRGYFGAEAKGGRQ